MANEPAQQPQPISPLPESRDPELEQFRIRSRPEIARVFRDMSKAGELVTAYLADREFFLTTILGIDAENARIFLDYGADERLNERALQAAQLLFVGRHYQVRVQFTAAVSKVNLKDGPALAASFPDSILRIQRREFYRLTTPLAARPLCRISLPNGATLEAIIVDISLGGIGIIETEGDEPLWEPGHIIKDVRIELPDDTRIQSDIEIRNRYLLPQAQGQVQYHIGCKFLHLESRMNADIQRYIHRVDLERRRLTRE
jgi:c-di-GMP-binding flagellar brake protein YcgR